MLSIKTCHREGDPNPWTFREFSDLTSWPVGDRLNWDRRAGTPLGIFRIWAKMISIIDTTKKCPEQ